MSEPTSTGKIASIIDSRPLASAIAGSVAWALRFPFVHLYGRETVWSVFEQSLNAAIRDINQHPRGKLFKRLIEYGPHHPDHPKVLISDGETKLSDPECGSCVEFIFSHMVNRFKAELAELLSLEPCITLIQRLQQSGHLPSGMHLYWGDIVQQCRRTGKTDQEGKALWGSFTKGADGLLVKEMPRQQNKHNFLEILGIVEVKSMIQSNRKVLDQIQERHVKRLGGGVKLSKIEWSPADVHFNSSGLVRIIVTPSTWKLSREWSSVREERGRTIVLPRTSEPPHEAQVKELESNIWKITLSWSQEALEQAAYEMTFWYMSQVGAHVYAGKSMPKGSGYMSPEEAGRNAIKMMLYYMPLRYISKEQERRAIKLYNVYGFGYPLGVDSKQMLWPEDFPQEDRK